MTPANKDEASRYAIMQRRNVMGAMIQHVRNLRWFKESHSGWKADLSCMESFIGGKGARERRRVQISLMGKERERETKMQRDMRHKDLSASFTGVVGMSRNGPNLSLKGGHGTCTQTTYWYSSHRTLGWPGQCLGASSQVTGGRPG